MKLGGAPMALGGAVADEDGDHEDGESLSPILFTPFYHNTPLTVTNCQSCDAIFIHFQTAVHKTDNFSTF